jgi:IclR family acetate operon transcriptional repressor
VTSPTPMTRPLTSARRTLEALDAIAAFRRPFRPPELSAALSWSRATTYQQLVTLVTAGWLERGPDGDYRLSVRAARISSAAAAQAAPSERLRALMQELVKQTREAATVALLDDSAARVLWRVLPDRSVSAAVPLAATLTPRSASGQVLLAYLPTKRREELRKLASVKASFPAERTLTAVRKAGHAIYRAADTDGVAAIAAPIFDESDTCVAALALTGPSARFEPETVLEPTIAAAQRISQLWRHVGDPAGTAG